jgi:hypothetical protein
MNFGPRKEGQRAGRMGMGGGGCRRTRTKGIHPPWVTLVVRKGRNWIPNQPNQVFDLSFNDDRSESSNSEVNSFKR